MHIRVSDTMNLIFENLEFDPTPVIQNQKERISARSKKLFEFRADPPYIPLDKLREKKHDDEQMKRPINAFVFQFRIKHCKLAK